MIVAASMMQRSNDGKTDAGDADSQPAGEGRASRGLRYAVPPLVLGAFALALVAEPPPADVDLMLVAPDYALPGSSLPLRALAVAGVAEQAGPTEPLSRPIQVVLKNASGQRLGEATLVAGAADTFEGELAIPADARGALTLVATTRRLHDSDLVRVERIVHVEANAPASARVGRLATPAQRWRPETVELVADAVAPADLDLRALGGACVPELPCELRLWVGEPAAQVAVEASSGLVVQAAAPTIVTAGIVPLTVTVRGAEAVAPVVAQRDDVVVARRRVRLPILMAGHALRLPQGSLAIAPAQPELEVASLDDARHFVVDAYLDDHWLHTASLDLDADGKGRLPFALGPGVWRLSVHADPFSTLHSAGRVLLVLAPGADAMAELRRAAARTDLAAGTDPLGNLLVSGQPPPGSPAQLAEMLFALPELDFHQAPELAHGILQLGPDLDPRRRSLRALAGGLVLLAGLLVAWLLIRRGRAAGLQADALLADAEREAASLAEHDETASIVYTRSPRTASRGLFAAAAFVVLVFALAALLVVSRGCVS